MSISEITGFTLLFIVFLFMLYCFFLFQFKYHILHPFSKEIRVLEYIENNFENLSYMAPDDTNEHILYDDNIAIYVEIIGSSTYEEGLVPNKVLKYFYRRNEINLDLINSYHFLFGDLGERYQVVRRKAIDKLDKNVVETIQKRMVMMD